MNKKKVAIVINSLTTGGAEKFVLRFVEKTSDQFEFYLILLYNEIKQPVRIDPDRIFHLNQNEKSGNLSNFLKLPLLAFRVHKLLRVHKIDTVFSLLTRPNFISCFLKVIGYQGKVLISERTCLTEYYATLGKTSAFIGKTLVKYLYARATFVIPNSQYSALDLKDHFGISESKIVYIPNFIDVSAIPLPPSPGTVSGSHSFTFIHIGRFRPEKNHKMLLDAFENIRLPGCKLIVLGFGDMMRSEIMGQVGKSRKREAIRIVENETNPFKYLAESDCLVLSSDFEGFPNVILEALAWGVPVISTDCKSGPREILAPSSDFTYQLNDSIEFAEYGILTPVKNPELLTASMEKLMTDADLYREYCTKSRVRARDFDVSSSVTKLAKIMEEN